MYLWPNSSLAKDTSGRWGVLVQPNYGGVPWGIRHEVRWACDNDAFNGGFNERKFFAYIDKLQEWRATCLFVTAPDIVGNALATLHRWRATDWAFRIHEMGYPVAFVAQDGQEMYEFPPEFDVLFVGGTTAWKLSDAADECIYRAQRIGKRIHVGRVNSVKRMRHFEMIGVNTCDGTYPTYEPDAAYKRLGNALDQHVFPLWHVSRSGGTG